MARFRTLTLAALGLTLLAWAAPLSAQQPAAGKKDDPKKKPEPTKFLRVKRDAKDNPVALETAVVRYASADGKGVTVDLVGAVHIGDKDYYDKLNKLMEQYDVLLYELVARRGRASPRAASATRTTCCRSSRTA